MASVGRPSAKGRSALAMKSKGKASDSGQKVEKGKSGGSQGKGNSGAMGGIKFQLNKGTGGGGGAGKAPGGLTPEDLDDEIVSQSVQQKPGAKTLAKAQSMKIKQKMKGMTKKQKKKYKKMRKKVHKKRKKMADQLKKMAKGFK